MTREEMIADIKLALKYSNKVSGSCNHAYMGSMALTSLQNKLAGRSIYHQDRDLFMNFDKLMSQATDARIKKAHDYVSDRGEYSYVNLAKEYFGSKMARYTHVARMCYENNGDVDANDIKRWMEEELG